MTAPRILVVAGEYPGPTAPYISDLVRDLIAAGLHVEVLVARPPSPASAEAAIHGLPARAHRVARMPAGWFARARAARARYRAAPVEKRRALRRSVNPLRGGARALILRDFALADAAPYDTAFDIVHVHYGVFGLRAAMLLDAGLLRARHLVVSFHGHDATRPVSARRRRSYRRMFARAARVTAPTGFLAARIEALGCPVDKLAVVPSGVDLARFAFHERRAPGDGPVQVLSVGRLVEQKGHTLAIEALARVVERHPALRYTIVGEGPERPRLEEQIQRLGLASHVALVGVRTHEEVLALMQAAHVFVQPSVHSSKGLREVLGVAVLEAQACGLPVVSSDVGGLPEAVPPGALVPWGDVEALAARLAAVLRDPQAWPALGRAGRAWVEDHFDQRALVARWLDLYRTLDTEAGFFPRSS